MQFSFIIPVKNSSATLDRTLKSILNQNLQENFEIIIVDNGSTDNTIEIASKYTDKIFSQPKLNVSGLRNFGAKNANGNILIFIDSDCVLDNDQISKASDYLKREHVGLIGSKYHRSLKINNFQKNLDLFFKLQNNSSSTDWLPSIFIIIKKEDFFSLNGFDEHLVTCEDVDFGYRLKKKNKLIISSSTLSTTHLGEPKNFYEFLKKHSWHSLDALIIIYKHPTFKSEIKYVVFLLYTLIAFATLIYGLIVLNLMLVSTSLFFITLPSFLLALKLCICAKNFKALGNFFLIYLLYFMTRIIILPKSIFRLINYINSAK